MSSISPTDGGYQYYQRTIDELEDDLKAEAEKSRRNEDNRIAEMEKDYLEALREKDKDTEETIRNIKENVNETLEDERKLNKAEVNRIKSETYDKFGRYQGNEADVLKVQLEGAKSGWEERQRADQRNLQDTEESYRKKIDEIQREHGAELEKVTSDARESANAAYRNLSQEGKSAYDEYIKDVKAKYAQLMERKMEESNTERREFQKALFDNKLDTNRQLQRLNENTDTQQDRQRQYHSDTIAKAVQNTSDTANEQNRVLRAQVRDLLENDTIYAREKASGTLDAIREYERDWYKREKMIQDGYEATIADQKRQAKGAEEHSGSLLNEALRDRDLKFANLMHSYQAESHTNQKELMDIFNKEREQNAIRLKREKDLSAAQNEAFAKEMNDRTTHALEEQAKSFNHTIKDLRDSDESKIKTLERQLHFMNFSDDPGAVSPTAEAHLRRNIAKEYEKNFAAEHTSNQGKVEELTQNFNNRLQDTLFDAETKLTRQERNNTAERHAERTNLLQHIEGAEFSKQSTLRHQDADHRREVENLNREFSLFMERQKRQNDEIFDNTKNDLYSRMQAQRQESEFNERLKQREFALQLNENSREYEKKLMDQKADYELMLHETKAEADREMRETARQHKTELEEQTRSFEQRVTQQELQHKERERAAQLNFQDELDKVRRTNNALLQRRS